jgi:hypothetical protein
VVAVVGERRLLALLVAVVLLLAGIAAAGIRVWSGSDSRVSTPFLSYSPPDGWSPDRAGLVVAVDAPTLTAVVHGPAYTCDGESHVRGFAAVALLPTGPAAGTAAAERLGRWFATASFTAPGSAPPAVTAAPPRPVRVAGREGPVDATVTEVLAARDPGRGGCAPTAGTVLALAAPTGGGTALLLVAGDTRGGPAQPPPPDRAALDAVLASTQLA